MAEPIVTRGTFAICTTKNGVLSDWYVVPASLVKSIKQSNESLASEDSGRTDDGVMHINWIKEGLRKWEVELNMAGSDDLSPILSRVQGKDYYVKIFDLLSNGYTWTTSQVASEIGGLHVYTSNSESDCYSGVLRSDGLYQGVAFSITEMGD